VSFRDSSFVWFGGFVSLCFSCKTDREITRTQTDPHENEPVGWRLKRNRL